MKLAIFGAGKIVNDFASIVDDLPGLVVNAIFGQEKDVPAMQKLKKTAHIDEIYTDLDKCLATDTDTAYIGLPNALHFQFAKAALEAGKNVICEKPFTLNEQQLTELINLAESKHLILLEAITNQYLANYKQLKADLSKLGNIKVISCNYSQYSSRYDAFRKGTVLPAFNPKLGGGALMDLNIYNIYFIVGLLGAPTEVHYLANVERHIDTSGVLIMNYPKTKVVSIGAKDVDAPVTTTIEGTEGSIVVSGPTNVLDHYTIKLRNQQSQIVDVKVHPHRMFQEFLQFTKIVDSHDLKFAEQQLRQDEVVMHVIDQALAENKIKLG